jgi:hypothetical protein
VLAGEGDIVYDGVEVGEEAAKAEIESDYFPCFTVKKL